MPVSELAVVLGVSLERVNYCIKGVGDEGYVRVGNFAVSKNKFDYACLLTSAGVVERPRLTATSISNKLDESNAPHDEINVLAERRGGDLDQFGGAFW